MTTTLATPQAASVFHQHALHAFLDQDTLDALAEKYDLANLRERRKHAQHTCRKCRERPCVCGEKLYD